MYKFTDFCNLMWKTGKKYMIISKKLIFVQTNMEFDGCHGNFKNDGHTIEISKFPQRMMEQVLRVSTP